MSEGRLTLGQDLTRVPTPAVAEPTLLLLNLLRLLGVRSTAEEHVADTAADDGSESDTDGRLRDAGEHRGSSRGRRLRGRDGRLGLGRWGRGSARVGQRG